MIGDARETYSDSTLKSFKKSTLIEAIRCLERNLKSANETIDIQTTQCEKLIDSTKKAYYEQGKADERTKVLDEVEAKLLANGFIITHHALDVWHEIAEQLKEQK